MSRSEKKKTLEDALSKNHGQKRRFRVRQQEEKERERELKEFMKEDNAGKQV